MNTQTLTKLALVAAIFILSSCGSSKSSKSETVLSSTVVNPGAKVVTSCQKAVGTDLSVNISAVKNSSGAINNNVVKIKFNRLSSTVTASGNIIRFFKWKVSGSSSYMDPTNLQVTRYDLSSGSTDSSATTEITASTVSASKGYYIELNDDSGVYQVLKAVVYNTSGSIVTQMNILIPQFLGVPADYAFNANGTVRAQILQDMHPLRYTDTTGWSSQTYADYYSATCF